MKGWVLGLLAFLVLEVAAWVLIGILLVVLGVLWSLA